MQQQSLIKLIENYCADAGIEPSTLGVRALGNSRFFDRLKRKLGKIEEDGEKLVAYMAANPPEKAQQELQDSPDLKRAAQ